MPRVDFTQLGEEPGWDEIPVGSYLCRLTAIRESKTPDDFDAWRLAWTILRGPFQGKRIYDTLAFSPRAMKRVQLLCAVLGIDTSGELDLTTDMVFGKIARVALERDTKAAEQGGADRRTRVPYSGYAKPSVKEIAEEGAKRDDDTPF